MTLTIRSQTEPPGDPRETPWPDTEEEPAGEPRETPWPDDDEEGDQ